MSLDPRARAELERLGVDVVLTILADSLRSGHTPMADVRLHTPGVPDPSRGDVERWVAEKRAAERRKGTTRHWWIIGLMIATLFATTFFGWLSLGQSISPEHQVAQCRFAASRAYPDENIAFSAKIGHDIRLCMAARGYEYYLDPKKCIVGYTMEQNAACYRPMSGLSRLIYDAEVKIGWIQLGM